MKTMLRISSFLALLLAGTTATAQSNPVVVELYTSQGCSSCPPADAFLGELTARDNVIPLAFHVTYWDRLGWKDTFGHKAFTERQYAYSHAFNNRSVWTPQFVVQGQDYSRNSFRRMVGDYISAHAGARPAVDIEASLDGNRLSLSLDPVSGPTGPVEITIAHYSPGTSVQIERGENRGRQLRYHNVVYNLYVAKTWNGRASKTYSINLKDDRPFAVIVQAAGKGPILAARHFR